MSVSPLSVPYFPIEGHLRRQAAAHRRQLHVQRQAAQWFGGGGCGAGLDPASAWTRALEGSGLTGAQAKRAGPTTPLDRDPGTGETTGGRDEDWPGESGTTTKPLAGGASGGTHTSCSLFQAPSDMSTDCVTCDEGSDSCHRNIEGDDETCWNVAPCDTPFSRDDFNDASSSDADARVNIDDAFTSDETDLLLKAWAILVQSTDLAKWAVCWITGNPDAGDCLVNHINGTGANVNIHLKREFGKSGFNEQGVSTFWGAGRINVFVLDSSWTNYVDIWQCGDTGGAEPVNKMCAAIDLSATLLHELTHACFRAWRDTDKQGKCFTSYLIENAFRWAIFHRYPDAGSSTCCSGVATGSVFGSSKSEYPNTNCVTCSTSSGSTGTYDASGAVAGSKEWWLEHRNDKPGTWP